MKVTRQLYTCSGRNVFNSSIRRRLVLQPLREMDDLAYGKSQMGIQGVADSRTMAMPPCVIEDDHIRVQIGRWDSMDDVMLALCVMET